MGSILHELMAQYGLTEIIHEPTHILEPLVSCVDLVFISLENSILETPKGIKSNCQMDTLQSF